MKTVTVLTGPDLGYGHLINNVLNICCNSAVVLFPWLERIWLHLFHTCCVLT